MGAGSTTNANVTPSITSMIFIEPVISWLPQRLSTLLTASSTSSLAGATPVSRSTIATAASLATPCTFAMAADRVAAMVFSASATRLASLASTSLRRASAAAAAFSCVSLASVCARARASAFFTSQDGGVGLVLAALRFRKIGFDAFAALLQNRVDPWQRHSRHQQIQQDEGQREPKELRRKRLLLE